MLFPCQIRRLGFNTVIRMNFRIRIFMLTQLLAVLVTVVIVSQLSSISWSRSEAPTPVQRPQYARRQIKPTKGNIFRIAIGGAISSKGIPDFSPDTIADQPMFWILLPSFCRTASSGYEYHFYFAYDYDDPLADPVYRKSATDAFRKLIADCGGLFVGRLHLIGCPHKGKPAWAQNDGMMAAYVDGMDFFYRLNDDTMMVTSNWTSQYIDALANMWPPYVGAVGPYCERGPANKILTHDFVHRTHVEAFGYYYPRLFTDWYADNWITHVYVKYDRARVLEHVLVNHTESLGLRYNISRVGSDMERMVNITASRHHHILLRYINATFAVGNVFRSTRHQRTGVISITLYGSNTTYTLGAIRIAQLSPMFYPGWSLRIYHHPKPQNAVTSDGHPHLYVPDNILQTLVSLGARLVPVTAPILVRNPRLWRHLVFDDVPEATYTLVCKADSRLSMTGSPSYRG